MLERLSGIFSLGRVNAQRSRPARAIIVRWAREEGLDPSTFKNEDELMEAMYEMFDRRNNMKVDILLLGLGLNPDEFETREDKEAAAERQNRQRYLDEQLVSSGLQPAHFHSEEEKIAALARGSAAKARLREDLDEANYLMWDRIFPQ